MDSSFRWNDARRGGVRDNFPNEFTLALCTFRRLSRFRAINQTDFGRGQLRDIDQCFKVYAVIFAISQGHLRLLFHFTLFYTTFIQRGEKRLHVS